MQISHQAPVVWRWYTHAVEETLRHLGDDPPFVRFPVLLEATVQFTCNNTAGLWLKVRLYRCESERESDIASNWDHREYT